MSEFTIAGNVPECEDETKVKDSFNALLANLKEAGFVVKDNFKLASKLITKIPDEHLAYNHSLVTSFTYENGLATIVGPLSKMESFTLPDKEENNHKWLALCVTTGRSSIIGITLSKTYEFTESDVKETKEYGGVDGDFILFVECEEAINVPKVITVDKKGYNTKPMSVLFIDNSEPNNN